MGRFMHDGLGVMQDGSCGVESSRADSYGVVHARRAWSHAGRILRGGVKQGRLVWGGSCTTGLESGRTDPAGWNQAGQTRMGWFMHDGLGVMQDGSCGVESSRANSYGAVHARRAWSHAGRILRGGVKQGRLVWGGSCTTGLESCRTDPAGWSQAGQTRMGRFMHDGLGVRQDGSCGVESSRADSYGVVHARRAWSHAGRILRGGVKQGRLVWGGSCTTGLESCRTDPAGWSQAGQTRMGRFMHDGLGVRQDGSCGVESSRANSYGPVHARRAWSHAGRILRGGVKQGRLVWGGSCTTGLESCRTDPAGWSQAGQTRMGWFMHDGLGVMQDGSCGVESSRADSYGAVHARRAWSQGRLVWGGSCTTGLESGQTRMGWFMHDGLGVMQDGSCGVESSRADSYGVVHARRAWSQAGRILRGGVKQGELVWGGSCTTGLESGRTDRAGWSQAGQTRMGRFMHDGLGVRQDGSCGVESSRADSHRLESCKVDSLGAESHGVTAHCVESHQVDSHGVG